MFKIVIKILLSVSIEVTLFMQPISTYSAYWKVFFFFLQPVYVNLQCSYSWKGSGEKALGHILSSLVGRFNATLNTEERK